MLARTDDLLANISNDDARFVRVVNVKARWHAVLGLAVAGLMVVALLSGMFLLTSEALSKPEAVNLALAQPLATLQIVAGIMLLSALLLVPARRLVADFGSRGIVEIDGSMVQVSENGLFSTRKFREPLDAYRGIVHRMRTTVSGVHHELLLVHPDARRDVVIALDRMDAAVSPASMIARLGLPEISAGEIARRR
jgi:cytochrome b561